jgi:hypothetical protein
MPKRVHSASERDDNDESSNTSKRTRKAMELVGEFNLPHRLHFFSLFRTTSVKNSTMVYDLVNLTMVEVCVKISFNCRAKGFFHFFKFIKINLNLEQMQIILHQ